MDILILDKNLHEAHIHNIKENNLDYSNILRRNKSEPRLTGLHFIEYDKMYPLNNVPTLENINDEAYLYLLMDQKGYKLPEEQLTFRPTHGIHCSLNQPIFRKMPLSEEELSTMRWGIERHANDFLSFSSQDNYKNFLKVLDPSAKKHLKVITLLQILECACFYNKYFSRQMA